MKTLKPLTLMASLGLFVPARAQDTAAEAPPSNAPAPAAYVYDQKLYAGRPGLVTPEQAQATITRFKANYPSLGSPRLLIYVNRELVDEQSGMKLVHRSERIESSHTLADTNAGAGASVKSTEKNTYLASDKAQPTLTDKQTARDVERIFGRPLRAAGASLADQRVAAELIADKPISEFIGSTDTPQARKDREALGKIADAVIEILISSKNITVPTISSSQSITIPDIQATAINLKDARILGQVSSAEVVNRVPPASLANCDVREITEATALALMDDMVSDTR